MNNKYKTEVLEDCTHKMGIKIENIPKEICMEISGLIGKVLISFELEFSYDAIVKNNNIYGVNFKIKE